MEDGANYSNGDFRRKLNFIKENTPTYYKNRKFAKKEAKSYKEQRADVNGEQGIRLEKTLFRIANCFVYLLSLLFAILVVIWFIHLVFPCSWKWLDNTQVQSIERILFASTLLSIAGKYFSKYKVLDKH